MLIQNSLRSEKFVLCGTYTKQDIEVEKWDKV